MGHSDILIVHDLPDQSCSTCGKSSSWIHTVTPFPHGYHIYIYIILYVPMHTHQWLKSNSHNPFSSILHVFVKSRLPPVSSNMAGWRISIVRLFQVAIDFGDFPTFALWYPLVKQHSYWTWPFILDLPTRKGDFPVRYINVYQRVSLP